MLRTILFALVVVTAAACGGKSKPATSTATSEPTGAAKAEHDFPPAVAAFHDKLSPLWHAEAGAARVQQTCAAAGELATLAEGVQQADAPAGVDAAAWGGRVGELRTAIGALVDDCTATSGANFATTFDTVHNGFHAMIDLIPHDAAHAEHGEHDAAH